ncbi:MAG TPA: tail fiber protein [Pyrinomonadaceae bacterium]|jgi:microcystin-dependent protein
MSDPFVAEIRIVGFNFAPTGWAFCNGQLLPISQNTALFSLLGTFYGGDGKSTFALPNLQGSAPIHQGQGSGLSEYFLGQQGGSQFVTLLESEMPAHAHALIATSEQSNENNVTGNYYGVGNTMYANPSVGGLGAMSFNALAIAGGSLPHNNMMPYLTLNFIIAMQGIFPPRS